MSGGTEGARTLLPCPLLDRTPQLSTSLPQRELDDHNKTDDKPIEERRLPASMSPEHRSPDAAGFSMETGETLALSFCTNDEREQMLCNNVHFLLMVDISELQQKIRNAQSITVTRAYEPSGLCYSGRLRQLALQTASVRNNGPGCCRLPLVYQHGINCRPG